MTFLESGFKKIWKATKKSRFDYTTDLKANNKGFLLFASCLSQLEDQCQLMPSLNFVGYSNNELYLPKSISAAQDASLNRKLYLNLILLASASRNLNLHKSRLHNPLVSRIDFLGQMPLINKYLDDHFENYQLFQQELFNLIDNSTSEKNRASLPQALHSFWHRYYLCRDQASDLNMPLDWLSKIKDNEKVPSFLFLSVPCLPIRSEEGISGAACASQKTKSQEEKQKTEKEMQQSSPIERVDFEKEEVNPIMHSFEKMEAVDEYSGGRKIDSGDDELENHADALEELDLNKVTKGGENAKSIFRSDIFSFSGDSGSSIKPVAQSYLYPEWSVKMSHYINDYCQLLENYLPEPFLTERTPESDYKKYILEKYAVGLKKWKRKIESFFSSPIWIRRLKEGQEIDYDSFVQDYVALQAKKNISGRWYESKQKKIQDISVFILFDQSLSTDSWIDNHRVLDIIIESIGQVGILFEDYLSQIQIAGTWSNTRHQCHFQFYKKHSEPLEKFYSRAKQIEPQGYTRLGPAIRHATQILSESQVEKKLLLLLTDGKPTDLDGYEGSHGIQDVKRACSEAEAHGAFIFSLAVEKDSKLYFPKMFSHYKILNHPTKLPEEICNILMQFFKRN